MKLDSVKPVWIPWVWSTRQSQSTTQQPWMMWKTIQFSSRLEVLMQSFPGLSDAAACWSSIQSDWQKKKEQDPLRYQTYWVHWFQRQFQTSGRAIWKEESGQSCWFHSEIGVSGFTGIWNSMMTLRDWASRCPLVHCWVIGCTYLCLSSVLIWPPSPQYLAPHNLSAFSLTSPVW